MTEKLLLLKQHEIFSLSNKNCGYSLETASFRRFWHVPTIYVFEKKSSFCKNMISWSVEFVKYEWLHRKTTRLSLVMKNNQFCSMYFAIGYMHRLFVSSSTFLKTGVYTGMHFFCSKTYTLCFETFLGGCLGRCGGSKRIIYVSKHCLWVLGW